MEQIDGRGVFSFCMCPGGILVPSSTEEKSVVLNGMSNSARNSRRGLAETFLKDAGALVSTPARTEAENQIVDKLLNSEIFCRMTRGRNSSDITLLGYKPDEWKEKISEKRRDGRRG